MFFTRWSSDAPKEEDITMEKGSPSSSSSSSSPSSGAAADSLNGLRFGRKMYFQGMGSGLPPKSSSPLETISSSPAKRGRTKLLYCNQPPRCQVQGCEVDLSSAKPYYSRHKVCGFHSKSPEVIVAGIEQRFCQQCSRFHQLSEFDQGKRSCRRRLAGHNERRRKPQPGSLFSSAFPNLSLLDKHRKTGSFLMNSYTSLPVRDSWVNAATKQVYPDNIWHSSSSQIPLSEYLQVSTSQPLSISRVSSEECLTAASDSTGAPSLLSYQPWNLRIIPSSSHWFNDNLGPTSTHPESDAPILSQFSCQPWGFKGIQNSYRVGLTSPELGLGQASHNVNCDYNEVLPLTQHSEGQLSEAASSVHHTQWPL